MAVIASAFMRTPTMILTGLQARKIGRLSALYPDADIDVHWEHNDGSEREGGVLIEIMDEWGLKPVRRIVVRENGWSNPSLSRTRAELLRSREEDSRS